MFRHPGSLMFLATAVVTACAAAPDPAGNPGGGGKADGELTTITFDGDWAETADGAIVAGSPLRIDYDLDRLTDCRGETNGSEVWGVTGFASFDGGATETFGVSRLSNGKVVPLVAELEVPAGAESVELWFQINNRWGCNAYDSNENRNYEFAIEQRANTAIVAFEADGSESLSGPVRAGDQLVVHYDPARLDECASTMNGFPQWSVTGYYQVDGGSVRMLTVTRADGGDLVASDPEITVPRGGELALWFEATNRYGCHAYDSENGANFRYDIE